MNFEFELMNEDLANQVVKWRYDGEYAIYDVDSRETSIDEMMSSDQVDCFVAINSDDDPVGFLECTFDDAELEIACFLDPDLTGQGIGLDFINECIDFSIEHYDYSGERIVIIVESFNQRAIKVFERIGFIAETEHDDRLEMSLYL